MFQYRSHLRHCRVITISRCSSSTVLTFHKVAENGGLARPGPPLLEPMTRGSLPSCFSPPLCRQWAFLQTTWCLFSLDLFVLFLLMISLFQTAPKQCANVLSGVAESGGSVASLGKNMCAPRTSLRQELQCDSVALTTVTWQGRSHL